VANATAQGDCKMKKILVRKVRKVDMKKVCEILTASRKKIGLSLEQMSKRLVCHRVTLVRLEAGRSKSIPRTKIEATALAYEIDVIELASLCGYPDFVPSPQENNQKEDDSSQMVTVEDLEYLLMVANGLNKPMSFQMVIDLLRRRQN
jgi:transcriptional regulator with XRE-family HTH domain